MKHRLIVLGMVVLLAAFLLTACGSNQAKVDSPDLVENGPTELENTANKPVEENTDNNEIADEPEPAPAVELTDAVGSTLTVEAPFQRIVSLAPSVTEILFAIGAGDQVVGREDFTNYPE